MVLELNKLFDLKEPGEYTVPGFLLASIHLTPKLLYMKFLLEPPLFD